MQQEILEIKKQVSGLQDRLDALLKKGETKFEVGKWYKGREPKVLFNYRRGTKDEIYGYGFDFLARWSNDDCENWSETEIIPATKDEIQSALIEEAKRRGFKEGVKVNCLAVKKGSGEKISELDFNYKPERDSLSVRSNDSCTGYTFIYLRGQWAEIIKEEKIEIGGYEVMFHGGDTMCSPSKYTTIDGYKFTKEFWQAAKTISEHSKAAVYLGCSAKSDGSNKWMAPTETINAILKKLQ